MNTRVRRARTFGIAAVLAVSTGVARAGGTDEVAKPRRDLVDLIRPTSMGEFVDRWSIRPYGWVETSLSTSPLTESDVRTGRVFDVEAEGFRLQQAYLALERTPSENRPFDVGGKLALLWGTDASLVHAGGLLDDQTGNVEQFDLLEAKATARFSIASGLTVSAGKCTTPMGFEVIEAPNNLLPSHSYLFGFAIPFTHTGVIASLATSDQLKLTYGLVEGWDVWDDNNSALTHLGSFAWISPSKKDSVTVNGIIGAEREGDDHDLRTVIDGTWTHAWSEEWTTTLNADVGFEERAAAGKDATWWGVAGYATRKFSDDLSATIRAEYFRDENGTRIGAEATLSELTVGLDWKPWSCLPNLRLRPEIRWDHSFDGAFFDDGTDDDQLSLTLDLMFTF